MKKILVGALLVVFSVVAEPDRDFVVPLRKAIEKTNCNEVNRLLQECALHIHSSKEKVCLSMDLLKEAQYVVQDREEISFLESPDDVLSAVGGAFLAIAGVSFLEASSHGRRANAGQGISKNSLLGTVLSVTGGFLLYKGLSCSDQKRKVRNARKIRDTFANILVAQAVRQERLFFEVPS